MRNSDAPSDGAALRVAFGWAVAILLYVPAIPIAFLVFWVSMGSFDDYCGLDPTRICPGNPFLGVLGIVFALAIVAAPAAFGIYAARPTRSSDD
jgi:hypothetical protein